MTIHERLQHWSYLERYSDTPMYNTKAVVQQTGVPAPTLRAWERRYALLAPERAENAYRLYSERDIILIRWLRERIDNGLSISQAIALFKQRNEEYLKRGEGEEKAPYAASSELQVDSQPVFQVAVTPPSPRYEQDTNFSLEEEPGGDTGHFALLASDLAPVALPNLHQTSLFVQGQLIDAFQRLDEATASMLMGTLVAVYPIEQVCSEIITPTLWEVGRYWAEGRLTVTTEHFASNFFRALLTNLYYIAPKAHSGPLTIVCSAPGEPHELASLMLALFLRRQGVHVAYLGQSIEAAGLIHMIRQRSPMLICFSLTIVDYLPAFLQLARRMQQLPKPPVLAFGGQGFSDYERFTDQIPGAYMGGDLQESTQRLLQLIGGSTQTMHE